MINSKRTFGVELEMGQPLGKDESLVRKAYKLMLLKAEQLGWNTGEDISIKDLYTPIEARSPILKGEEGEKNFRGFCDYVQSLGFTTNDTCGTHIHLGGEGYSTREPLREVALSKYMEDVYKHGYNTGIAIDADVYDLLVRTSGDELNEIVIQANNDEEFSIRVPMIDGRTTKLIRVNMFIKEVSAYVNIIMKQSKVMKILGDEVEISDAIISLGKDISIDDVIFLSRDIRNNVGQLRDLFYFYTAFDSILFSMLPKQRRIKNRFCKPLSTSYSTQQIANINSIGKLEKMWYSARNTQDLINFKREQKHSSRRHSINLHSLLGGIGTIEVRLHDGSLDTEELLKWIELHQYILDAIQAGLLRRDDVRLGAESVDFDTKIAYMLSSLRIPKELESYIKGQIKKHK